MDNNNTDPVSAEEQMLENALTANMAMCHVIVESGFVPGITSRCRCKECAIVAVAMDIAGYLEDIEDKWWVEDAPEVKHKRQLRTVEDLDAEGCYWEGQRVRDVHEWYGGSKAGIAHCRQCGNDGKL